MSSTFSYTNAVPAIRREGQRVRRSAGFYDDFTRRPDVSTSADEAAWLMTVVDGGADSGESVTIADDEPEGALEIVTNDADDDSISLQLNGEAFSVQDGRVVEYEARLKSDDVGNTDLAVGFAVADTDILGGVSDSLMFRMNDGSGEPDAVAEKDSTETSEDTGKSMSDGTYVTLRIEADSGEARFYVDEELVATVATNIPDDEALSPFIEVKNRSAAARTLTVSDLSVACG